MISSQRAGHGPPPPARQYTIYALLIYTVFWYNIYHIPWSQHNDHIYHIPCSQHIPYTMFTTPCLPHSPFTTFTHHIHTISPSVSSLHCYFPVIFGPLLYRLCAVYDTPLMMRHVLARGRLQRLGPACSSASLFGRLPTKQFRYFIGYFRPGEREAPRLLRDHRQAMTINCDIIR